MQDQRVLLAEGLAADAALEGLGARVDPLVAGQLRRPRETLVAVGAPVRVLPGVQCNRHLRFRLGFCVPIRAHTEMTSGREGEGG